MTFDVDVALNWYINHIGESGRWLPIVALVILWFEARYLMFRSPKKQELEDQLRRSELLQIYYRTRLREILIFVLATILSWMLFFSFIFCQHYFLSFFYRWRNHI